VHSCAAAASVESKMATMQHKIFCICEFIKTESATAVQRAFRLRFNIQPPTMKSICFWNHQFEQIGRLCKGKSSGRPPALEEPIFFNHTVHWPFSKWFIVYSFFNTDQSLCNKYCSIAANKHITKITEQNSEHLVSEGI